MAQATEQADLRVITAGPPAPNPAELLGSARMRTIVERLAAAADIVIFDCSPINLFTDPAVLSTFVDGSIVVVDADHTPRDAVRAARDALSIVGTRILGLVMNRMPNPLAEAAVRLQRSGVKAVSHPATADRTWRASDDRIGGSNRLSTDVGSGRLAIRPVEVDADSITWKRVAPDDAYRVVGIAGIPIAAVTYEEAISVFLAAPADRGSAARAFLHGPYDRRGGG